jgi:hypothetical protein
VTQDTSIFEQGLQQEIAIAEAEKQAMIAAASLMRQSRRLLQHARTTQLRWRR